MFISVDGYLWKSTGIDFQWTPVWTPGWLMKKGTCSSMPLQTKVNQLLRSIDDCLLTVKVFKRDVQIHFSALGNPRFIPEKEKERRRAKRSKIVKFSKKSAKRLRHIIRNSEDTWKVFITLTYPQNFPCNGKETKVHLNSFLQYLRRKKIKYVWVLEFQARGAPHYHIITSDHIQKEELSECWYTIVGSGDEKHLKAGTGISSIQSKRQLHGYLSNYVEKLEQKTPPAGFENVGRFWGATRGLLTFQMYQQINHYYKLALMTKIIRKWRKAHLRQFGIKWKWKGLGFTALDGTSLVNRLMALKR